MSDLERFGRHVGEVRRMERSHSRAFMVCSCADAGRHSQWMNLLAERMRESAKETLRELRKEFA